MIRFERNIFVSCALFGLIALSCAVPLRAKEVNISTAWRADCVGRFQLDLPADVDIAVPRLADVVGSHSDSYAFVSGTSYNASNLFQGDRKQMYNGPAQAWGSKQVVGGRRIFPGPELTPDEFKVFKQGIDGVWQEMAADYLSQSRKREAAAIHPIDSTEPDLFIWGDGNARDVYFYRGTRAHLYRGALERGVVSKFRAREPFEVPAEPGLCLHYGFLPDDGQTSRDIGVTYRLKDHPEVEIFFEDSSAGPPPHPKSKLQTAADEVQFFWEDNYGQSDKQHKIIHPHIPGTIHFPDVKLGGYSGKSSLVELTHRDSSVDYGYMAYVKGDSSAKEDAPTLMLYVIRRASRAKGELMTKEQIKDMANRIAASVRRHPMGQ